MGESLAIESGAEFRFQNRQVILTTGPLQLLGSNHLAPWRLTDWNNGEIRVHELLNSRMFCLLVRVVGSPGE